jgi:hypothetical protein
MELLKARSSETKKKIYDKVIILMQIVIINCFFCLRQEIHNKPQDRRRIDDFDEGSCKAAFRFRRNELKQLFILMKFPQLVRFEDRSVLSGEEIFLRGLFELCTGEDQYQICNYVFGRDQPVQSRAFKFFIEFIFNKYGKILCNGLKWFFDNGLVQQSADAITRKHGIVMEGFKFAFFIDCNCLKTSRVGGMVCIT